MSSKKLSKKPTPVKPSCQDAEPCLVSEPKANDEETAIRALQKLGYQFYFGHAKMTTLVRFVWGQMHQQPGYLIEIAVPEKTLLGVTARETLAAKATKSRAEAKKKKRGLAKAKKTR